MAPQAKLPEVEFTKNQPDYDYKSLTSPVAVVGLKDTHGLSRVMYAVNDIAFHPPALLYNSLAEPDWL